ncbi:Chaperone DnaJ-domain superfamily protein, putative isoform 1 [Hibiscus syriacus]|uniref:Chaperone DnaJ-domain superfamily protein, putative isoform 1 n=1 Tax=Hibiscus syriacus TaxID=106335 RepID=A0A6A2ZXV5_HIBSY|nr:Chaperone DnaJ-domain superfamily protein, putative isoform 1 [Hibiscus syriacus]
MYSLVAHSSLVHSSTHRHWPSPHATTAKCLIPSRNSKPQKSTSLIKPLVLVSASAVTLLICITPVFTLLGGGGGGNSGESKGGGGGGSGGDDGSNDDFWEKFFSPSPVIADNNNQTHDWDSHGLPFNIVVQLNKLSGFQKYKLSDILFFDRCRWTTKELETLATCGMFEKFDMEGKTNADGTLGLTSFTKSTWQSTDREKLEYYNSQGKDYRRRIERARPCMLPMQVHREVLQMLRDQGKVSVRLLKKIRDMIQQWYHDEGYACAQVVNFGNLNTKEVERVA